MASIAKKYGFADYKTIYNHAENAELKAKRPKPNLLAAGDIVSIPDKDPGEKPGGTEQKHKFKIKRQKTKFRVTIKDDKDKPFADKKYELKIGKKTLTGDTDAAGFLEQEIPADAATCPHPDCRR